MTGTKTKRPPKTLKEKKWAKEYIKTGNATEAADRTYNAKNRDVARNIGSQNVAKLSFSDFFEELGFTDKRLIDSLIEATKATKMSYHKKVPDWNTRIKAIDMCMRLKGTYTVADLQAQRKAEEAGITLSEQSHQDSLTEREKQLQAFVNFRHSFHLMGDEMKKDSLAFLQEQLVKFTNQNQD